MTGRLFLVLDPAGRQEGTLELQVGHRQRGRAPGWKSWCAEFCRAPPAPTYEPARPASCRRPASGTRTALVREDASLVVDAPRGRRSPTALRELAPPALPGGPGGIDLGGTVRVREAGGSASWNWPEIGESRLRRRAGATRPGRRPRRPGRKGREGPYHLQTG